MSDPFNLRNRREGGATPALEDWGVDSEYGVLRDILLGPADNYQWLETSSVSKKSIRRGYQFDAGVAQQQHAEMISAYQTAGVEVHLHAPDPVLPYQIFARDSSIMTPFGAMDMSSIEALPFFGIAHIHRGCLGHNDSPWTFNT